MEDMRSQILYACCPDINSSVDDNIASFNIVRVYGRNVELPQLLTEIISGLFNFCLCGNLFIRNLPSES
jgi:hypothetical protein